jgi:predicted ATPase
MEEARLQQGLMQLVNAELLYQRGLPPQAQYTFKHVLIQEAAYQSVLRSTRRQYHRQISQVLEERFPETRETHPELLAHHYVEAGLAAQAVPYWRRAGQCAIERSASLEAISHLTKGLEVLKTLPATPERNQQELSLQLALGMPLLMAKGHTAPEVEHAYRRAQELCQQVEENSQLFSALVGLWRFYLNRAWLQAARERAEQCFSLAERTQDPTLLQEAHLMLGSTLFFLGDLGSALRHLEQGITLYNPRKSRSLTLNRGTDPGVVCLSRVSWALWMLGYPDQALAKCKESLALAQESSHAYSLGFALHYAAGLHQYRREVELVQERAEAAIALSSEQGFIQWLGGGRIWLGWTLVKRGAVEEGVTHILEGQGTKRAMGSELGMPHNLSMLVEGYAKGGQIEEGLRVVAEALAVAQKNAECHHEAELYRLKGELLLQQAVRRDAPPAIPTDILLVTPTEREGATSASPLQAEAENCFRQALDVARYQQAKSLELRAAMSLSRLWRMQGKQVEARELLAEVYYWFTEGFDTPDLQEARALLEALA